jgi:L-threonylcarbamoyladenylate synthase
MLEQVADLSGDVGARAEDLMLAFWPGPLTLLLPRRAAVPDAVTAGRALVGVRMPKHPVARELIRLAGVPVAAPSANRFGRISPTTAAHVLADLDGRIDAVLDGGPTTIGVESTVIGPDPQNKSGWLIYRPGGITAAALEEVCGTGLVTPYVPDESATPQSQPSPGSGIRHYAPRARLVLVRDAGRSLVPMERSLVETIDRETAGGASVGVMLPDGWNASGAREVFRWGPWSNAETLARLLYLGLRMLDQRGVSVIVCPVPQAAGLGEALRDRLEKAAK